MSLLFRIRNIKNNEIHLWFAEPEKIRSPQLISLYRELLDQEEKSRLTKFRFEKDRHQFLVCRALVRSVLSHYFSLDPADWRFKRNRYGKPEIDFPDLSGRLRFNLSHTDGLILCGVTLDHDLGVDVENTTRKVQTVQLAELFFSPCEVDELKKLDQALQIDAFYKYWTLKESYIKACGMGMALQLNKISFKLEADGRISVSFAPERKDVPEAWKFRLLEPSRIHRAAVGIRCGKDSADFKLYTRRTIPFGMLRCFSDFSKQGWLQTAEEYLF